MMTPTVHLNGTSAGDLLESYMHASSKLRDALDALVRCGPNARDYYVKKEPGAFEIAREEHQDRVKRLTSVIKELEALSASVADFV